MILGTTRIRDSHHASTTDFGTADDAVLFRNAAVNADAKVRVAIVHMPTSKKASERSTISRDTVSQTAAKQPIADEIVFIKPIVVRDATSAGIHLARNTHRVVYTNATVESVTTV